MIVPDINVLVYAFRRDVEDHDRYAEWLSGVLAGGDEIGLADSTLVGFVRIVTNPRIFADPAPTSEAMHFTAVLRAGRRARRLQATESTWQAFATLVDADRHVRGNLVPDAWLAALATSHRGRVATADKGFARFPGVASFDPVAG